ncbi:MAG: hypothetical protein A3K67_05720 [Euryarchaeota archaeon RBG_16_62_10]|nr:MAG: hypothetical protein A3K67_05720 [Euryarchaeota archaeon RBG_16_62_10]
MRFDRAITVAKKDIAEFARNKYVLMTIVMMPMIAAVILPIVYVVPINQLSRQTTTDLDLVFDIRASYSDVYIGNTTLFDTRLEKAVISNCVIRDCIIVNSSVSNCNLNETRIEHSSVTTSILHRCVLLDLTADEGNTVRESFYVNGNEELDRLQTLMFNVLLILLVMTPVTIPTVTASYSFVGEKVNRSLEPLLATPITDLELLVGKSGSIFAVSMGATWISFVVAVALVDVLTRPVLGYYPLPNAYWIAGMVLLAPGMCLMSILANVLISSKVNDVRVSQQIGGVLVLPVLLFFFFSLSGVLSTGVVPMVVFSLLVFAGDAGIAWLSLRVFRREEILVSWK